MSGLKSTKGENLQKPLPQCVGGAVFDLRSGMSGQLTGKSHRDGAMNRRNHPDVAKRSSEARVVQAENQRVNGVMRKGSSGKKSGGMPMKMLIAHEMSKETESKKKQPNVVARLMGLDEPMPDHHSVLNARRSFEESSRSSRVTLAGALQNCRQREDDYCDMSMPLEVRSCVHEKEYRDVREVWKQPKDCPLQKGPHDDIQNERRMALVRQKFMEAKRLATDERLLQSREFQDALEVLSSNRDLFLRFLEEPNSLFAKNLKELHSTHAAPQTKRITVLKPSKTVKGDTQVKKQHNLVTNEVGWNLDRPQRRSGMTQPTRIVVLKPSPGKPHDTKPTFMPHISSPKLTEKDDFSHLVEAAESLGYRGAPTDISWQTRESVCSSRRDESLLSSVLSNGYVGDESSFSRSENEYEEEEGDNFSNSEITTPTSRHSWDYSNRYGSSHSLSSVSRVSYSPEPLVIKEAKKRLSERWSLVASNGNDREQIEVRRSSSTLGEMLAISEVKKAEMGTGGLTVSSSRSYAGEDLRVSSASSLTCQIKNGDGVETSPTNLSRSNSVPISSALNSEVLCSQAQKPVVAKDTAECKSAKSSFKGKVSSLFFSRNKKSSKEKPISSSPLLGSMDGGEGGNVEPVVKDNENSLHSVYNGQPEGCHRINSDEEPVKELSPASVKSTLKQGTLSFMAALSLEKLSLSESLNNNQDSSSSHQIVANQNQPSPTSVLDVPFEDDTTNTTPNSSTICNAVTPVESVARTLEWDDDDVEMQSTGNMSLVGALHIAEEQQRHLFVQKVLSAVGLDKSLVFAGWHSVDFPVDPFLLEKFLDRKEEDARSRKRRSNQRLLFDCVNYALLEIGRNAYWGAYPWACVHAVPRKKHLRGDFVGNEVCALISDWFSGEVKSDANEIENANLVVDGLLRREVGGSGWAELTQSEIDELGKEITGQVFEELVGETLMEFTVGCL